MPGNFKARRPLSNSRAARRVFIPSAERVRIAILVASSLFAIAELHASIPLAETIAPVFKNSLRSIINIFPFSLHFSSV
jgi:hypothetical protein